MENSPTPPSTAEAHSAAQAPCSMLVMAAGRGRRFGGESPKQYQTLLDAPILAHAIRRLHAHPLVDRITPVIAPDGEALWALVAPHMAGLDKVTAPAVGGDERQHSVFKGLASLNLPPSAWVGIHDGARPLVDGPLLDRLFAARGGAWAGVIPAIAAPDTLKQVDGDDRITATVDRAAIRLAQTPQIFPYGAIMAAHQTAREVGFLGTDDASLMERLGQPVRVVAGSADNLKITQARDLALAAFLLQRETDPNSEE